ncbi:MAG: helix-turn-helix domain-containing protein [Candidatus Aminicenantes bacterium]|nr:helix-turn-helix domain-containing protein [Candidatus Aenigmarchaeota archaeon]NIO85460.1 helix-turn-helix domain-containing protein [Candidatus Aminicenantes bacterium]NIQ71365.1 helix-turn-helix domain-containing protein [Candidatus Aminicenantes bacterium]NIT27418.1 helix-turn-helix domain-containing protein [Candidatus Aminicenantes bacterium]
MPEKVLKNTLKVQRAKKDLTQEQLAQMVGVTRKTINTVEKGKYVPSTYLALKLAKVLGVPVEELFQIWEDSSNQDA